MASRWIAWIVAVIALVSGTLQLFMVDSWTTIIAAIGLSLTLTVLLVLSIYRELTTARKEKYANIQTYQHRIAHLLRDLETHLDSIQPSRNTKIRGNQIKQIQSQLSLVLDSLANAFSLLTGTNCRTSIKTLEIAGKRVYIQSFSRDSASEEIYFKEDLERAQMQSDPLDRNQDFEILYEGYGPDKRCFFCNDLSKLRGYRNTSLERLLANTTEGTNTAQSAKNWPLPYISTIVWPIQQRESPRLELKTVGCVGFLTVDSPSRNVFKRRWDVDLGAATADALFHTMNRFIYKFSQ